MIFLRRLTIGSWLAGLMLVATGPPCAARVWHVLADSTGDAPFLAAAVDSASDDDVIELGPGEFPVTGHYLGFQKRLEIVGAGAELSTVLGGLIVNEARTFCVRDLKVRPGLPLHELLVVSQVDQFEAVRCIFFGGSFENRVNVETTVRIVDCRFESNVAYREFGGGGLTVTLTGFVPGMIEISNCVFEDNTSPNGTPGQGRGGGGLQMNLGLNHSAVVRECLFVGNEAPSGGAMSFNGFGYVSVLYNTFVGNRAEDAALFIGTQCEVYGNIFAGNDTFGFFDGTTSQRCNCNLFWRNRETSQGEQWIGYCYIPAEGHRQVIVDPDFCNRRTGNYELSETSPALPENYPPELIEGGCEGILGALGIGCTMSPTIVSSWGKLKQSFAK